MTLVGFVVSIRLTEFSSSLAFKRFRASSMRALLKLRGLAFGCVSFRGLAFRGLAFRGLVRGFTCRMFM